MYKDMTEIWTENNINIYYFLTNLYENVLSKIKYLKKARVTCKAQCKFYWW